MPAKVFFAKNANDAAKLFCAAGFGKLIAPADAVALKLHFGEPGNTAYLKPDKVNGIAAAVEKLGGKPFFTDCNTLYRGPRNNTQDHLAVAREHGYQNVFIPEENDCLKVEVNLKHFRTVFLGGNVSRANSIIALTHFKGHELTGFGGTLKNLGMGFATRLGKLKQHQDCRNCAEIKTCRKNQTIESCWVGSSEIVQEKLVEYAAGALKGKKSGFFNFIIDVSPNCDCFGHNDPPIVPDIGALTSLDPVAIDQAALDLVGQEKFSALYPEVDCEIQLKYAEALGLGSRKHALIHI